MVTGQQFSGQSVARSPPPRLTTPTHGVITPESAAQKFTIRGATVDKEAGFLLMRGKRKKLYLLTEEI